MNAAERQVLGLARAAPGGDVRARHQGRPAGTTPHRLQVGQGLSRSAVLGSAGFELAGYADVFAPGGGVGADVIRRGSPDPNLSRVVVGTTQLRSAPASSGSRRPRTRRARRIRRSRWACFRRRYGVGREPRPARAAGEADEARVEPPLARRGRRRRREPCSARAARRHRRGRALAVVVARDARRPGRALHGLHEGARGGLRVRRAPAARLRRLRGRLRRGRPDLRGPAARGLLAPPSGRRQLRVELAGLVSRADADARDAVARADHGPGAAAQRRVLPSGSLDEASFFELLTLGLGLGALPAGRLLDVPLVADRRAPGGVRHLAAVRAWPGRARHGGARGRPRPARPLAGTLRAAHRDGRVLRRSGRSSRGRSSGRETRSSTS